MKTEKIDDGNDEDLVKPQREIICVGPDESGSMPHYPNTQFLVDALEKAKVAGLLNQIKFLEF